MEYWNEWGGVGRGVDWGVTAVRSWREGVEAKTIQTHTDRQVDTVQSHSLILQRRKT